jgi:hypothetical protein
MHTVQTETAASIVGSSNNARLKSIDADAQTLVASMISKSRSIRQAAAELVVAGVMMADIRETDRPAWEEFRKGFGTINVKGADPEYREIAHVLWRACKAPPKGSGSLANTVPQVGRDKISRDAAAMATVHKWYRSGCTDPAELATKIVRNGGVRACAKLHEEKLEHDHRISGAPLAPKSDMVTIRLPRPDEPLVIIVMPSGQYREADAAMAEHVLTQTELPAELVH